MNRHERRASVSSIRHSDLITHLVAADAVIEDAILRNAVLHWRINIETRKPVCIGCKAAFNGDQAQVAAFLLSTPVGVPDIVATGAICTACHATLSPSQIDVIATRILRQLSPGGKFLDPP